MFENLLVSLSVKRTNLNTPVWTRMVDCLVVIVTSSCYGSEFRAYHCVDMISFSYKPFSQPITLVGAWFKS